MKKFLFGGLLALSLLGLAIEPASASFSICGQKSCTYSFSTPRIWFGFDCGAQACPQGAPCSPHAYPAAPAAPYAPAAPGAPGAPAGPVKSEAEAAATTQPASYRSYTPSYQYPYTTGNYAIPSYWYGR